MLWNLIGMFFGASVPAATVLGAASSLSGAVRSADRVAKQLLPPAYFDDTEYYLQHLAFKAQDAERLGLPKTSYTLLWSAEELGRYALLEGWILTGTANTPKNRAEIRALLERGEQRQKNPATS